MPHLDYYLEHNISPVRYNVSDLSAHFQRRGSLYRSLGLLPATFRNADVLEVAAGSGQNSLYIATLMPNSYTLLEPNPSGASDIRELYSSQHLAHTAPQLIQKKLEEYSPEEKFDIVICENWLGSSDHERALLRKLSGLVRDTGVLVVTAVSPVGFFPNLLRRALAAKLFDRKLSFSERTNQLVLAFGTHLETMGAMTRSPTDWVQDNMINPAYYGLCLTIPRIIGELGEVFEAVDTNPTFNQDWRWFKSLHGEARKFNDHLLEQYWSNALNFIDYRTIVPGGKMDDGRTLEADVCDLLACVQEYEESIVAGGDGRDLETVLVRLVRGIQDRIGRALPLVSSAMDEASALLIKSNITPQNIAAMQDFKCWFGRETLYISMQKESLLAVAADSATEI